MSLTLIGMVAATDPGDNNKRQTGLILTGIVEDGISGEILTGVKVVVEGTDLVSYADLTGAFVITGIDPGRYDLTVEMISYEKKDIKGVEVMTGEDEKLKVSFDPSSTGLSLRSNL